MPGMLIVVTASLVSRWIFKTPSVFIKIMQVQGLNYANDPLAQLLRRLAVFHRMERKVVELPPKVTRRQMEQNLSA